MEWLCGECWCVVTKVVEVGFKVPLYELGVASSVGSAVAMPGARLVDARDAKAGAEELDKGGVTGASSLGG